MTIADRPSRGSRRAAGLVLAIGLAGFAVIAWRWVPWHPVPGAALSLPSAEDIFTDQEIAGAEHFNAWARVWSWSSLGMELLAVTWLALSGAVRRRAERLAPRAWWWVRVLVLVLAVQLILRLATLPLGLAQLELRRRHGLTHQLWPAYLRDQALGLTVGVVATGVALVVVMGLARRLPRTWPAAAGAALGVLVLLGSWVYPVVVEPLFNRFTPLADGSLRTGVFALADREQVPVDDVLVADASRRTTTLNAYVSGFGSTRRVVLYDNLVEGLPESQTLSIVAHELAHARHGDVLVGTALGMAGAGVGIGLLGLLLDAGAVRRRFALGRPVAAQVAAVPLVVALSTWGSLLSAPVQNGISRQIETRADVDALGTTGSYDVFVSMQQQLAARSLADPTPPAWSQWAFGSHPTVLRRIAVAERMRDLDTP